MIRTVVIPFGRGGIVGGSMLGLGRALGETIAVALILSPSFAVVIRILEPGGNTVAATIANEFNEAKPFGIQALLAAGLALFVLTLVVNMFAAAVVSRSRSRQGVEL
jgi:phosphate transport system permease protein